MDGEKPANERTISKLRAAALAVTSLLLQAAAPANSPIGGVVNHVQMNAATPERALVAPAVAPLVMYPGGQHFVIGDHRSHASHSSHRSHSSHHSAR